MTFKLSSRSSSSLSATLLLHKKIFTNLLLQSIQNQLLQMKLESQAQKIQLKKTETDRLKLQNEQIKADLRRN